MPNFGEKVKGWFNGSSPESQRDTSMHDPDDQTHGKASDMLDPSGEYAKLEERALERQVAEMKKEADIAEDEANIAAADRRIAEGAVREAAAIRAREVAEAKANIANIPDARAANDNTMAEEKSPTQDQKKSA